jgi:hypothetical protein
MLEERSIHLTHEFIISHHTSTTNLPLPVKSSTELLLMLKNKMSNLFQKGKYMNFGMIKE